MNEPLQLLVLGTGCAKCNQLYATTEQAAKELGVPYQLSKVSDLKQIMALRVMVTPALVVNGNVKLTGRVPGKDELKGLLQSAAK
ncbi:MAG TPA: thioredoxin family protein [Candidatus Sulfotelmatobacter sp.]|nr:thioredoxin family protein [Candidatus Sulfotelmatobacter sp.]